MRSVRRWAWLQSILDFGVASITLSSAVYLMLRAWPYRGAPAATLAMLVVVLLGIIVVLVAVGHLLLARRRLTGFARLPLYVIGVGLAVIAVDRVYISRRATAYWPPRAANSLARNPGSLPPADRARWAAGLFAHARTRAGSAGDSRIIPEDWPMPGDASVAVDRSAFATYIWGRAGDSLACITIPVASRRLDSAAECDSRRPRADELIFSRPERRPDTPPSVPTAGYGDAWLQYRGDPQRSGSAGIVHGGAAGWRTATVGPVRSSVSVVGQIVLVGGHETGALTALDLADGSVLWRTRLPNWIHQDAVSDGSYVVVGFGNTWPSFAGRAPSGVAAYELATGRHLWTRFDESSVMTSAMIADSTVIYATAAGILRKRALRDGRLLGEVQLPGGVIMAPLAMAGNSVVATLDRDHVCAARISPLSLRWCRRFAHMRMLGHAAPAVADGRVVISGLTTLLSLTPGDMLRASPELLGELTRRSFVAPADNAISGQTFLALDLETGATSWHGPLFLFRQDVSGHIAGTAVLGDGTGVIVLPVADSLVAFDPRLGAVSWSAPGHQSRGPPLVIEGKVVLAGSDGIIEIRELADGRLTCSVRRSVGWDRAGPVHAGDLLIFANLKGEVEAIPVNTLLRCETEEPR